MKTRHKARDQRTQHTAIQLAKWRCGLDYKQIIRRGNQQVNKQRVRERKREMWEKRRSDEALIHEASRLFS